MIKIISISWVMFEPLTARLGIIADRSSMLKFHGNLNSFSVFSSQRAQSRFK